MARQDTVPVEVRSAPVDQREQTLTLVFSHLQPDQRRAQVNAALGALRAGKFKAHGLLQAIRGTRVVGGSWCYTQPGRTAVVCAAQLIEEEPESTAEQLYLAMDEFLSAKGVRLAQGVLNTDISIHSRRFVARGYRHITDLLYLVSSTERSSERQPDGQLAYKIHSLGSVERMEGIVNRTYEGTLDCPSLNGVRATRDVLDGYAATGQFSPSRWFYVTRDDRDVGCLLLADHPQENQWELVYIGLIPSARGNGWGLEMARFAQWLTGQAGRSRLVLAVDVENGPAIDMYAAAGFSAWDRRSVFLKVFFAQI